METLNALKQVEGRLQVVADKSSALGAKLEELVFRAQRIAASKKNGGKSGDTMFSYDLQGFRRELRAFGNDVETLPSAISSIERSASYDENLIKHASAVKRVCDRINKGLELLHDQALLAHTHIRESDARIEAWFVVQETGQLAEKGRVLPNAANRVVIRVSPAEGQPPAAPAAPAPAVTHSLPPAKPKLAEPPQ